MQEPENREISNAYTSTIVPVITKEGYGLAVVGTHFNPLQLKGPVINNYSSANKYKEKPV